MNLYFVHGKVVLILVVLCCFCNLQTQSKDVSDQVLTTIITHLESLSHDLNEFKTNILNEDSKDTDNHEASKGNGQREYFEDGFHCTDIDECQTGDHNCTESCFNTIGSYKCIGTCDDPSLYLEGLGCIMPILTRMIYPDLQKVCEESNMTLLENFGTEHLRALFDQFFDPMNWGTPYVGIKYKPVWVSSGVPLSEDLMASYKHAKRCGRLTFVDEHNPERVGIWDEYCNRTSYGLCHNY